MGHAVWSALAVAAALAGPGQGDADRGRPSLEDFLERARARRVELHAQLQYGVDDALEQLESPAARESVSMAAKLRRGLRELGPECTPLLVGSLEPGEAPEIAERFRAEQVAEAMAGMDTRAVTRELLALLSGGSAEGRRNAAIVLAGARDVERASVALEAAFHDAPARVQEACLSSLARLGGDANGQRLAAVLRSDDADLEAMALRALALAPGPQTVHLVRELGPAATQHAKAVLAFYTAARDHVEPEDLAVLIGMARSGELSTVTRTQLLQAVAEFPATPTGDHRELLEPLADHPDRDLREAARVALVLAGDRAARRALIREADDLVDKSPNWSKAWARRGDLYYRMRDYGKAISEYRKSLQLGRDDPQPQTEVAIQLARAYARARKLREAREALRNAGVTRKRLQELADDPAFAELRDSRYGDVFE